MDQQNVDGNAVGKTTVGNLAKTVTATNARGVAWTPVYDGAGNMASDGANSYLYDADGRVCAVLNSSMPSMPLRTGYLYDADGGRVAKGTIATMSCDPTTNGFQITENYVLGPGGEELTTLDGSNTWLRTNVYVGGRLMATYDLAGLHFHLTDPLGTRRVELSGNLTSGNQISSGQPLPLGQAELDCQSLPFGDQQSCTPAPNAPPSSDDATPLHFTGKERDAESGNDYFGARYYASTMGRFMSPDWSAKEEPVPYATMNDPQSLNLYAYVLNNPLRGVDPDGHEYLITAPTEEDNSNSETNSSQSVADQQTAQQEDQQQSPQVQSLVDAQNAAMANGTYQPNTPTAGTTHCSEAACAIAKGTGADLTGILYDSKGNKYDANTQINNLANSSSYHVVTPDQAQVLGDKGVLVFGTQHGARHGHIASVRPEGIPGDNPKGRSGPILANVGLFNGVAHQSAVMTPAHGAIVYYAPNQ